MDFLSRTLVQANPLHVGKHPEPFNSLVRWQWNIALKRALYLVGGDLKKPKRTVVARGQLSSYGVQGEASSVWILQAFAFGLMWDLDCTETSLEPHTVRHFNPQNIFNPG